jgi:hypothetical protein
MKNDKPKVREEKRVAQALEDIVGVSRMGAT